MCILDLFWARSTLQSTFEGRCEKRRGLCTNVSSPSEFKDYDPNNDRLDSFLYLHMGPKRSYQSLWKVVADLLILSHGQASAERGYSINKQLEVENLQERSFISQDHIQSVGGVLAVSINLCSCQLQELGRSIHRILMNKRGRKPLRV